MKKILIVLLTIIIFCGSAFAVDLDWANMTDDEINAIISAAQAELANRAPAPDNGVVHIGEETAIVNENDIVVTLTGKNNCDYGYLDLEAIIQNNSSEPVSITIASSSLNDWEISGSGISGTGVGKKQKGEFSFCIEDADISTIAEIEKLEVTLDIYNSDSYDTIFTKDLIIVP